MTTQQIKKTFDKINRERDAALERLAAVVMEQHVKPFCDRLGVKFCSGMGSWNFEGYETEPTPRRSARAMSDFDSADLPKTLADLLHLPIDHFNDLAALMDDYTPTSYKPAYKWGT